MLHATIAEDDWMLHWTAHSISTRCQRLLRPTVFRGPWNFTPHRWILKNAVQFRSDAKFRSTVELILCRGIPLLFR